MSEVTHQPRTIETPTRWQGVVMAAPDPGPMGLRCLHPFPDPAPPVTLTREILESFDSGDAFWSEYRRCAFDGCVCRCHVNGPR